MVILVFQLIVLTICKKQRIQYKKILTHFCKGFTSLRKSHLLVHCNFLRRIIFFCFLEENWKNVKPKTWKNNLKEVQQKYLKIKELVLSNVKSLPKKTLWRETCKVSNFGSSNLGWQWKNKKESKPKVNETYGEQAWIQTVFTWKTNGKFTFTLTRFSGQWHGIGTKEKVTFSRSSSPCFSKSMSILLFFK